MKGLSNMVLGLLERSKFPLTSQEICQALELPKSEVKNISAVLAMYLKSEHLCLDEERRCSVTDRKAKTYNIKKIKNQVITENLLVINLEEVIITIEDGKLRIEKRVA